MELSKTQLIKILESLPSEEEVSKYDTRVFRVPIMPSMPVSMLTESSPADTFTLPPELIFYFDERRRDWVLRNRIGIL